MITMATTIAEPIRAIRKWIHFQTNNQGKKTAIVFDLKNLKVQEIMEDFFDTLTAIERLDEPTISFEEVKKQLLAKKRIV